MAASAALRNVRSVRLQLSYLRDLVARASFTDGVAYLEYKLSGRGHRVLDSELYSVMDLVQVEEGRMKRVLDELLDRLVGMAARSLDLRDWLEKAAPTLRAEDRTIYRSLLGLPIEDRAPVAAIAPAAAAAAAPAPLPPPV